MPGDFTRQIHRLLRIEEDDPNPDRGSILGLLLEAEWKKIAFSVCNVLRNAGEEFSPGQQDCPDIFTLTEIGVRENCIRGAPDHAPLIVRGRDLDDPRNSNGYREPQIAHGPIHAGLVARSLRDADFIADGVQAEDLILDGPPVFDQQAYIAVGDQDRPAHCLVFRFRDEPSIGAEDAGKEGAQYQYRNQYRNQYVACRKMTEPGLHSELPKAGRGPLAASPRVAAKRRPLRLFDSAGVDGGWQDSGPDTPNIFFCFHFPFCNAVSLFHSRIFTSLLVENIPKPD